MIAFLDLRDKAIGVIGAGNIGGEIIGSLYRQGHHRILAARRNREGLRQLEEKYPGIAVSGNNLEVTRSSEVVILGVKPKVLEEVAREVSSGVGGKLVVSLAASKSLAELASYLGGYGRTARVMTEVDVARALAFYALGREALDKDRSMIRYIFGRKTLEVEEGDLDGRTYLACDYGILALETEAKLARMRELGMDESALRRAYGHLYLALGKHLLQGKTGEELYRRVTGGSEESFTARLHSLLAEKGYFAAISESVEWVIASLRRK